MVPTNCLHYYLIKISFIQLEIELRLILKINYTVFKRP